MFTKIDNPNQQLVKQAYNADLTCDKEAIELYKRKQPLEQRLHKQDVWIDAPEEITHFIYKNLSEEKAPDLLGGVYFNDGTIGSTVRFKL